MNFVSSQSKSFTKDRKKVARLTHRQKEEKHTCEEALNSGDGELLVVEEEGQLAGEVEHRVLRMCGNEKSKGKHEKVQEVADLERELGFDILVEEAEGEDGERGVEKIVHSYEILPQGSLQARVDWIRKVT